MELHETVIGIIFLACVTIADIMAIAMLVIPWGKSIIEEKDSVLLTISGMLFLYVLMGILSITYFVICGVIEAISLGYIWALIWAVCTIICIYIPIAFEGKYNTERLIGMSIIFLVLTIITCYQMLPAEFPFDTYKKYLG